MNISTKDFSPRPVAGITAVFLLSALMLMPVSSNAETVHEINFPVQTGGGAGEITLMSVELAILDHNFVEWNLVFSIPVTPADAGRTFSVLSGPGFDVAARYLTNGVDDFLELTTAFMGPSGGWGGGTGGPESYWFFGDPTGARGIDLVGDRLTAIDLKIDALSIEYVDGMTNYITQYSIITHSVPIPEPGTWLMILFGLTWLGWMRHGTANVADAEPKAA